MITIMLNALPFLGRGLLTTLEVSLLVVVFALISGLVLGVGLSYGPRLVAWPIRLLSDFVRGVPILVLIFAIFYMLPLTGWKVSNFWSVIVALTVFETMHVSEVARGAIQSIHPGQNEAGKSIGLTFSQRMIYVVFPQALRRFLPPWINTVVDTVKGSALISLVGIVDLMLAINQVIGRTFKPLPLYVLGCIIYFIINYTLSLTSRRLEARFSYVRE
jgi:polar amino acid transport system permease protein